MIRIDIPKTVAILRLFFERNKVAKRKFIEHRGPLAKDEDLEHCYHMLDEIIDLYNRGHEDEAAYHLGGICYIIWKKGMRSLAILKSYTQPFGEKHWR